MPRPTDTTVPPFVPIDSASENLSDDATRAITDLSARLDLIDAWNVYHQDLADDAGDVLTNPGGTIAQSDELNNFQELCTVEGDDQIPDSSTAAELRLTCRNQTPTTGTAVLGGDLTIETSGPAIWNGVYWLVNAAGTIIFRGTAQLLSQTVTVNSDYRIDGADWDFSETPVRLVITPNREGSSLSAPVVINRMFFSGELTRGDMGREIISYLDLPPTYDGTNIIGGATSVGTANFNSVDIITPRTSSPIRAGANDEPAIVDLSQTFRLVGVSTGGGSEAREDSNSTRDDRFLRFGAGTEETAPVRLNVRGSAFGVGAIWLTLPGATTDVPTDTLSDTTKAFVVFDLAFIREGGNLRYILKSKWVSTVPSSEEEILNVVNNIVSSDADSSIQSSTAAVPVTFAANEIHFAQNARRYFLATYKGTGNIINSIISTDGVNSFIRTGNNHYKQY
ncbi:MAG: hypothetical protein K0U41_07425 [Gammaproteobacteria bacterium]|nr:hypothetical protein [Gammaproteobacteria bacterium]